MRARDGQAMIRPWSGAPPLPIVSARGCTVTDADGREYLDLTAGYFVNQVGHCHPKLVAAATRQLHQVTQVSGKQTTPAALALAERLIDITPRSVTRTFFATGGSEATEFALRMARQHRGTETVAYLDNAYHGLTLGALEVCANEGYRKSAGASLGERTYRLPTPYCYRCEYARDCHTQCLDPAESALDARPDTAALIAEPMQAVGGIIPPERWWARVDAMRKRRGMLLILDEIQTGLGRTGTMFAAEQYDLQPDLVTIGKGLGGGVGALSAVVASDAVADAFRGGTSPTNAGNAVSAAAGLALIDVIAEDDLLENCRRMGGYLDAGTRALDDPWIGDVRFRGLFGGVELVCDRSSKRPLPAALMAAVQVQLRARGVLLSISGMHGNVLRIQPPLCIDGRALDAFLVALQSALRAIRTQAADARAPGSDGEGRS